MAKRKKKTTKAPSGKKRTAKKRGSKAGARKKTASKSSSGRRGLVAISTRELRSELRRREQDLTRLESRREKLAAELAAVEGEIRAMGGMADIGVTARGSIRRRPKNDANLADSLAKLLKGKTMSVTEASEKVVAAGYRTTAANFRTIVNQTLLRDKRFKKISRGKYTVS